jgi:general secretion pathway protein B
MSFILDALKKSESERQRQAGPALFEVKVAPPRLRFPLWGVLLGLLLGANLIVLVVWLLLRGGVAPSAATPPVATPATLAPAALAPPAPPLAPAPPAASPAVPAVAANVPAPTAASAPAADPRLAPAADATEPPATSADEEPAVEPAPLAPGTSHIKQAPAGLPTREEAMANGGVTIPALRLDLHVYASDPRARYVLLNMRKLRETESLPDGVRVDRITDSGVELSYRGTRFALPRE